MKKLFAFILAFLILFSGCSWNVEIVDPREELSEPENEAFEPEEPSKEPEIIPEEETENAFGNKAIYDEMIFNFGAIINYEGKLTVRKGVSFYYNEKGVSDYAAEDPMSFYSWMESRFTSDDKILVSIPGFSGEVYAFSADFFESEVFKFFGINAEKLRISGFYYPEQNCYFVDGHGGIGDTPELVINSIEENGEMVIFHLTLDYEFEDDRNMVLTVKLLPDGGYNYVSYLPEA